ncbi:NAD(P)-binding protein [Mycena amicta]|nr:NAD(P)-binding protein [Mycena amicta]
MCHWQATLLITPSMTITQDLQAPLVVVAGITGNQGGSVVRALAESEKPYRIRGLTRDVTKHAAQEFAAAGADVVAVSLTSDNVAGARDVCAGADVVFAVTNYWEHVDVNREVAEGKMLIDAAKSAGVGLFIWSSLESIVKVTNGKYPNVPHFNGKGEIAEYGRGSGIPFIIVQAGWYATNFSKLQGIKPKLVDGQYVLGLPVGPQTLLPVIDTAHDFGLFVREAIESPEFGPGSEILTSGEMITVGDLVTQLAQITGKNIVYQRIGDEEFMKATQQPPSIALELLESLKYHEEYGYFAGKDVSRSRRHLARPTRTWAEFVQTVDWDAVLE